MVSEKDQMSIVVINSIDIRKPTLEDVFLYYTGRKIRDQEASGSEQFKSRFMHH